ncbi:MAG: NAD(P)/FAD-dependent oxidoreductase [Mycobacteriales bacterium]
MPEGRRRIAVIGGGGAGLTAAYVLQRRADVTLFEGDDRLGGHAQTHEIADPRCGTVGIDSGFSVHNERTYPTLLRLFRELGVATQESDMSMSIRCGGCGLQYAGGRGVSGLVPSRRSANPRYAWMLTQVVRFHRQARRLLTTDGPEPTLKEFLTVGRFSRYFRSHFIAPLVSTVWSCTPTKSGDYPARFLFRFLANHGALSVTGSPTWYTVVGGSARYVEKLAKGLTAIATATPVRALVRTAGGVEIWDDTGVATPFDSAVVATHPNQALDLLAAPTTAESRILGAIGYTSNPAVLHTDGSVLPQGRRVQASWNYRLPTCAAEPTAVHVSYNVNRLQRLTTDRQYVVTLNGGADIDERDVLARMVYEHPVYDSGSVAARGRLPQLNDGRVAFAGAYHGWGFHEDACRSGVAAAASLGVTW